MAVYQEKDKGTWRVGFRYTDFTGERKQTQKRGFKTKREATAWEHEMMLRKGHKLDMTFESFYEIYSEYKRQRVKESTFETKSHIVRTKILPYFGKRKINEITVADVIAWQNEMMAYRDEKGKHVRTKKEILDEDGNLRPGCKIIKKGELYETNFFQPKNEEFKSNVFLENMKRVMTDAINEIVKDENEKLQVFQKGGPYLATKKIGKNNPKADEIKVDNYLRQEWNRNVDWALLTGASEVEVMTAKQSQIDVPVAKSLREHGQNPKLFTGILC